MLRAWVLITSWGGDVEIFFKLEDALSHVHELQRQQGWLACDFSKQNDRELLFREIGIQEDHQKIVLYHRLVR